MKFIILLFIFSISRSDLLFSFSDWIDSSKDLMDSSFTIVEEIEMHPKNPEVDVFINITKSIENFLLKCFKKQKEFSKYNSCINRAHPLWNLVSKMIVAVKENNKKDIVRLTTEIFLSTSEAVNHCRRL